MDTMNRELYESLFKKGLQQYRKLIQYKCRQWSTAKLHEDDLFSESCIVLMRIVRHHHQLGIESNEFKNLLMKSIKNRVVDLKRKYFTKSRNQFLEKEYDQNFDDLMLEDAWSSSSYCPDPSEVVETIQLIERLHSILSEVDRKMLDAVLNPSEILVRRAREKDIQVQKSGRRSNGAKTEIPVYLLGDEIGLTYRQAMRSLDRIRHTIQSICDD